ncbi:hypothetical protein RJT34_30600 [Clitoria ternatea]|uniref:Uncharacterized protein n=1 Tax=Clitoria ternatea TaxID=43366 RepID=A0AAN9ETE4_CLITE
MIANGHGERETVVDNKVKLLFGRKIYSSIVKMANGWLDTNINSHVVNGMNTRFRKDCWVGQGQLAIAICCQSFVSIFCEQAASDAQFVAHGNENGGFLYKFIKAMPFCKNRLITTVLTTSNVISDRFAWPVNNKEKMEAFSFTLTSTHQPVRSISLPTRVHPSSQRVEALLNHLKPHHHLARSLSSTICLEAERIQSDLVVLAELYNCMEELFQSPHTQKALLHYQNGKLVEEALCGSITLLDACGTARDLSLALKEHVQSLQSAIRRRRRDSSIENSICEYECFRKKAKKEISKQLGAMKKMENKVGCVGLMGQDQHVVFLARVVREANTITISIFRSLLLFLSMPGLRTKGSSMISKLKPTRLFSSEREQKNTNVVDLTAVCSFLGRGKQSDAKVEIQSALKVLETLNASIDGLEGGLDCIFRRLVQNRVSFLNMLAH